VELVKGGIGKGWLRLFQMDRLIIISAHISGMVINIFMSPWLNGARNHQFSRVSLLSKMFPFFISKKRFSDLY